MSSVNKFDKITYLQWKNLPTAEYDEFAKNNKEKHEVLKKIDKQRIERGIKIQDCDYDTWCKLSGEDKESMHVVNRAKSDGFIDKKKRELEAEEKLALEDKEKKEKERAEMDKQNAEQKEEDNTVLGQNPNEHDVEEPTDTVVYQTVSAPTGVPKDEFAKMLNLAAQYAKSMVKKYGIPFEKLDKTKQVDLIKAALCCILNGPFNPHNKTTFGDKEYSIESCFLGAKFSNNDWKEFCRPIAVFLKSRFGLLPCNMVRRINDYWPLAEYVSQKSARK